MCAELDREVGGGSSRGVCVCGWGLIAKPPLILKKSSASGWIWELESALREDFSIFIRAIINFVKRCKLHGVALGNFF